MICLTHVSFTQHMIPLQNIISFGSDGCNTMFGTHNSVSQEMKTNFPGVYLMKCICHSSHLAFSEAYKNYLQDIKLWYDRFTIFLAIVQNNKANSINFKDFLTYKITKYCILQLQDGCHYCL